MRPPEPIELDAIPVLAWVAFAAFALIIIFASLRVCREDSAGKKDTHHQPKKRQR